jgi:hypothetical protein
MNSYLDGNIILLGNIQVTIDNNTKKFYINTNDITFQPTFSNYENVLEYFVQRGAAGKFKDSHYHSDLFIPIVLTSNKISYIIVEVKNDEGLYTFNSLYNNFYGRGRLLLGYAHPKEAAAPFLVFILLLFIKYKNERMFVNLVGAILLILISSRNAFLYFILLPWY